jgi:hypothetical protein
MSDSEENKLILEQLRERQNAFEEQMTRYAQEIIALRRDFQVQAAENQHRWAEDQRRWADVQADIRELIFENQRILRWLERQQQS